jgi:hypothetical protein
MGPEPEPLKIKTAADIQREYGDKYLPRLLSATSQPELWNTDTDVLAEALNDPDNEPEKQWRRRILIENTPRGNVYMFYDLYKRAFSYYCDQAVMPYHILNAVAMKYVLTYHCLNFFVDSSVVGKKTLPEKEPEKKRPEPININIDNKVPFAKLKNYNTASKRAEISKEDEKTINCFLYLGGVRNWSIIDKPKKTNPLNGFKTNLMPSNHPKLSYKDYKLAKK